MDPLAEIRAYLRLAPDLGTAGQPTAQQFRAIRAAGFEQVVNLALATSPGALLDEEAVVREEGLSYVHIPIDFKAPDVPSALRFFELMHERGGRPTFVHCIANFRVSALVYAYRVAYGERSESEARADLEKMWTPDPAWQRYIEDVVRVAGVSRSIG